MLSLVRALGFAKDLSPSGVSEHAEALFSGLDKNGDGVIDKLELFGYIIDQRVKQLLFYGSFFPSGNKPCESEVEVATRLLDSIVNPDPCQCSVGPLDSS